MDKMRMESIDMTAQNIEKIKIVLHMEKKFCRTYLPI